MSRRLGLECNVYEDMRGISAKRGLRPQAAKPSARLSAAGRQMVALLCAPEIAMFGYTAEGFAPAAEEAPAAARASTRASTLASALFPALAALSGLPI